jgi:hypothetical protein
MHFQRINEILLLTQRGCRESRGAPRFVWLGAVANCKQRQERLRDVTVEEAHSDMGS